MRKAGNILVTGGRGFIGTHLIRRLVQKGSTVTCLDIRTTAAEKFEGVNYVTGDVRDVKVTEPLVSSASAVFHLAAEVSVSLCEKSPPESTATNFNAAVTLGDCLRRKGDGTPIFFSSSSAVYGALGDRGPTLETDSLPEPLSFYGAQKRFSETALNLYRRNFSTPVALFRFFNVYGPGQDWSSPYSGVISRFCSALLKGDAIQIFGDGEQTRDFVYVEDVVDCLTAALGQDVGALRQNIFNVGTGQSISINTLAATIAGLVGRPAKIDYRDARLGDIRHSRANVEQARNLLAFNAKTPLAQGLRRVLDWMSESDASRT